jgi:predicted Zn-dependent peptidase
MNVNADTDVASEKAALDFARALFGDHPLARIVSKSDLGKVTRSDVDSWIGRVHNLHNAALVVVGDVDPAEVQRFATEISLKIGQSCSESGKHHPILHCGNVEALGTSWDRRQRISGRFPIFRGPARATGRW